MTSSINGNTRPPSNCSDECCSQRGLRNCLRLSTAAGFSFIGGIFSFVVPGTAGVFLGAASGGLGNGLSTLFTLETQENDKTLERIKQLENTVLKIQRQYENQPALKTLTSPPETIQGMPQDPNRSGFQKHFRGIHTD